MGSLQFLNLSNKETICEHLTVLLFGGFPSPKLIFFSIPLLTNTFYLISFYLEILFRKHVYNCVNSFAILVSQVLAFY